MFDIGWSELLLIGVVALVVVGPKELPGLLYTVAQWVRRARMVAANFQSTVDQMMREAELEKTRKELEAQFQNQNSILADTPKAETAAPVTAPTAGDSTPAAGEAAGAGDAAAPVADTIPPVAAAPVNPVSSAPVGEAVAVTAEQDKNRA